MKIKGRRVLVWLTCLETHHTTLTANVMYNKYSKNTIVNPMHATHEHLRDKVRLAHRAELSGGDWYHIYDSPAVNWMAPVSHALINPRTSCEMCISCICEEDNSSNLNQPILIFIRSIGRALQEELPVADALCGEGCICVRQLAVIIRESRKFCINILNQFNFQLCYELKPLRTIRIWASSGSHVSMMLRISVTTSPAHRSSPAAWRCEEVAIHVMLLTRKRISSKFEIRKCLRIFLEIQYRRLVQFQFLSLERKIRSANKVLSNKNLISLVCQFLRVLNLWKALEFQDQWSRQWRRCSPLVYQCWKQPRCRYYEVAWMTACFVLARTL